MTRHPSRRISERITRRITEIAADCNYASRRSVELNMPWAQRHDPAPTAPRQ